VLNQIIWNNQFIHVNKSSVFFPWFGKLALKISHAFLTCSYSGVPRGQAQVNEANNGRPQDREPLYLVGKQVQLSCQGSQMHHPRQKQQILTLLDCTAIHLAFRLFASGP